MQREIVVAGRWIQLLLLLSLTACGGSKVIKQPKAVVLERPLASAADQRLEASLDWVVVRDGPGSWATNADWDEYRLRVRNLSGTSIHVTAFTVHDSLGTRVEQTANRQALIAGSRATVKRYKGQGLRVKAGVGGPTLVAVGTGAFVAGQATAIAVLSGSAGAGAAGVAVGAVLLAPVLMVGGVVRTMRNRRVARELVQRRSVLPVELAPGQQQTLVFFVPLAPSPPEIVLSYADAEGEHALPIDTRSQLSGMHLRDSGSEVPQ